MPIYEYVCGSCGSEFEAIQKFSDAPLTKCMCGESGKVERKLSLAAFQLKGGGWYKEGYAGGNGGGKSAASSTSESSSDSSSKSEGSTSAAVSHSCGASCACA